MAVNALFITTIFLMAMGLWLLQECQFLVPYRALLVQQYASTIAAFAAALFVNVFAGVYLVCRKVFLKDTGRKLAHLEKQLRTGASISDELAARLREE
jgi:hypothetical protein